MICSDDLKNPKKLYDKPEPFWDKCQKDMFEMSSPVSNSLTALSILQERGWELAISGESRLFLQANNPEIIQEFSQIVRIIGEQDALIDIIGKVSLDQYINQKLTDFEAKDQGETKTCYAHAVAATFHLILSKRCPNPPDFEKIKNEIIEI